MQIQLTSVFDRVSQGMVGTTDWDKAYHSYSLCVCTNETTDDFKFVFEGLKNVTRKNLNFEMEQNTIVCDAAFAISNAFVATFGENVLIIMCWSKRQLSGR